MLFVYTDFTYDGTKYICLVAMLNSGTARTKPSYAQIMMLDALIFLIMYCCQQDQPDWLAQSKKYLYVEFHL